MYFLLALLTLPSCQLVADHVALRIDPQVCGRNALVFAAAYCSTIKGGSAEIIESAERILPDSQAPFSVAQLICAGAEFGLKMTPVRWREPSRASFETPAIIRMSLATEKGVEPHFAFVVQTGNTVLMLCDALNNEVIEIDREAFLANWGGEAIYVSTKRPISMYLMLFRSQMPQISALGYLSIAALILAIVSLLSKSQKGNLATNASGRRVARMLHGNRRRTVTICILAVLCGYFMDKVVGGSWQDMESVDRSHFMGSGRGGQLAFRPETVRAEVLKPQLGATVAVAARLQNSGERPVRIDRVASSCSCAVVDELVDAEIAAGEGRNVTIRMRPPKLGTTKANIQVVYAKGSRVATLPVELIVRSDSVEIAGVRPDSVEFVGKLYKGARQQVSITMLEGLSAISNAHVFVADLPEVECKQLASAVLAEQDGIRRVQYLLEINLREVPIQREFGGVIRVHAAKDSSSTYVCRIGGLNE